jgi:hypothetical protein
MVRETSANPRSLHREPRTVASGKICCNNSCALGKMSALDDEVLPLSYGLNLSECGGNRYLTRLIKRFPFPPKAGLTGRVAKGGESGADREYPSVYERAASPQLRYPVLST